MRVNNLPEKRLGSATFVSGLFVFSLLQLLSLSVLMSDCSAQSRWDLQRMKTKSGGQTIFHSRPIDKSLINQWPTELEAEFQRRAAAIIESQTKNTKAGINTYFENEKRSYGFLMAHILGGNEQDALKKLQAQDHQHQQWHRETEGIDYYACFTLKHQIRKYFYFGDLLEPQYKKRMYDGAKKWTAKDPMRQPHYAYDASTGWGPNARNSWVDIRSTENLYLMRVTSVYLMAEETGNKQTAKKYKDEILNYTRTLLRVGIGEWDSENYLGHSMAPLLNLYDFADDIEIKRAAKACLDFYTTAAAIKYYRGGFNGPTKRDYNHAQPFGGSAANALWVWFGNHPQGKQGDWESDEIHQVTSAYRPPLAAVKLARKEFDKPVEIFAGKPPYEATTSHHRDAQPEYAETQFIANSFLMGSLTGGTSVDGGDVNGFKILAWDQLNGAIALHAAPTADPRYPGSPMYKRNVIAAENRVAQQQNLAIWLVADSNSPWLWVIPDDVEFVKKNAVTFLKCDKTWVGIHGLGTSEFSVNTDLTNLLTQGKGTRFKNHKVLFARGIDQGDYCGIAIEVGEKESHGSFDNFARSVSAAEIDMSELAAGIVRYRAKDGKHLGIHWNDNPMNLGVWRNGKRRKLENLKLYESPIINADWGTGTILINTGKDSFQIEFE